MSFFWGGTLQGEIEETDRSQRFRIGKSKLRRIINKTEKLNMSCGIAIGRKLNSNNLKSTLTNGLSSKP